MHTIEFIPPQISFFQENANPTRHYSTKRGTGPEALEVKKRLAGFDPNTSPEAKIVNDIYKDSTKSELISATFIVINIAKQEWGDSLPQSFFKFDRITRRSKDLILKWYKDHWEYVKDIVDTVALSDSQMNIISHNVSYKGIQVHYY